MSNAEAVTNNIEQPSRPLFVLHRNSLEDLLGPEDGMADSSITNSYSSDHEVYGATVMDEIVFRLQAAGLTQADLSKDHDVAMDIAWTTVKEESSINVEAMLACTPWNTP